MRGHLPRIRPHGFSAEGDHAVDQDREKGGHCSGRCPREIDIPRVMETLRHMSIEENIMPDSKRVKDIRKFHEIFIDMVKKYGRNYELRMMAEFNIRTRNLFKDMHLAPKALAKGKIKILPGRKVKSAKAIKRMYDVAEKLEKRK
jgi:heterodisulfide reductase subunit C